MKILLIIALSGNLTFIPFDDLGECRQAAETVERHFDHHEAKAVCILKSEDKE